MWICSREWNSFFFLLTCGRVTTFGVAKFSSYIRFFFCTLRVCNSWQVEVKDRAERSKSLTTTSQEISVPINEIPTAVCYIYMCVWRQWSKSCKKSVNCCGKWWYIWTFYDIKISSKTRLFCSIVYLSLSKINSTFDICALFPHIFAHSIPST